MRTSNSPRTLKPNQIPGRFIPNKPNEPQLGKIRVKKADGSIETVPMSRKDRRTLIRAERKRLNHEKKKTP